MQSTTMFVNNTISNKIEFHGIKTVYPVGERVQCFFTIPDRQPECGDWIGIFPVGWTSMVRDCLARQTVRVEQLNGQYGQIEFDATLPYQIPTNTVGQYYQFVYVSNAGEYVVLGSSSPFRFGGEMQQQPEQYQPERFGLYGNKTVSGEWFTGSPVTSGRYYAESEIQKLQNEIYGLEQGLYQQQQQQVPTPFGWTGKVSQGVWQPKMVKIEQILKEKVRIEQAQRRLEQLCLLAQLKSCERHIVNVQKREPEIHSFLLKNKMQAKIAVFEQKVNQVVKMTTTTTGPAAEQYVRKYEQLLREKIQLDMEKRRVVLHKLRLTIRECERKLRELQTVDQEYLAVFHQSLKTKLGQFAAIVGQEFEPAMHGGNKHFETIMGSFLFEQEKKTIGLFQAQRELTFLINEMCGKLQELEFESGCYSTLRIPRISTGLMFNSHPKLAEIVQLEKKIAEQKLKLKLKMIGGGLNGMTTRFIEQLARGVWFGPVVEKLRLVQLNLAKLNTVGFPVRSGVNGSRVWTEKKTGVISQFIQTFVQFQSEAVQVVGGQQSLFGLFEHIKTRQVLTHLRELKERECMEIIRFFQENNTYGQSPVVVELVQHLVEIVSEKMNELTTFTQWYQPQQHHHQQTMPVEWLLAAANWSPEQQQQHGLPSMLELFEYERKLVEMKGLTLATVHATHLSERLVELEQFVHAIESVQKRERLVEKIKSLKRMVEEHVECYQPSFVTIPEQYFAHQQKYEKMCQLVGELECHFIEQVSGMPAILINGQQPQPQQPFGGESRFVGLALVHQKFFRLIQEFQVQFPECFSAKVEEISKFLRSEFIRRRGEQQPAVYGQELKEKLVEFETILCQPECEIACLATALFPQSTTTTTKVQRESLKYLIRQVRDLKHQVQYHLNTFVMDMQKPQPQQPEQQFIGGEESQLINLLNKNMWINEKPNKYFGARVPHNKTVVESTTTSTTTSSINGGAKTTLVKSLSMPVNGGLMKPIEKFIREEEQKEQEEEERIIFPTGSIQQQLLNKMRFGGVASFDLVEEYDEDEEDFDFGTDAEITISTILNGQQQQQLPAMIRIEDIINAGDKYFYGGEQQPRFYESAESCLCQIEKHIRKSLKNGGEQRYTIEQTMCPICTVETTTTTSTGVVRKF